MSETPEGERERETAMADKLGLSLKCDLVVQEKLVLF